MSEQTKTNVKEEESKQKEEEEVRSDSTKESESRKKRKESSRSDGSSPSTNDEDDGSLSSFSGRSSSASGSSGGNQKKKARTDKKNTSKGAQLPPNSSFGLKVLRGLRFDCAPYTELRSGIPLHHAPVVQGSTDARAFSISFQIVEGEDEKVKEEVKSAMHKAEMDALAAVGGPIEKVEKKLGESSLPSSSKLDGVRFVVHVIDSRSEEKLFAPSRGGPLPIFSTQTSGTPIVPAVKGQVVFENLRIHYLSVKHRDGRPVQRLKLLVEPAEEEMKRKYPHLLYTSPSFESHSKTRLIRRKIRAGQAKLQQAMPSQDAHEGGRIDTLPDGHPAGSIASPLAGVNPLSTMPVLAGGGGGRGVQHSIESTIENRLRTALFSLGSFAQLVHASDLKDLMAKAKFYYEVAQSKWTFLGDRSTSDRDYLQEELYSLLELGQTACMTLFSRCSTIQNSLQQLQDELNACSSLLSVMQSTASNAAARGQGAESDFRSLQTSVLGKRKAGQMESILPQLSTSHALLAQGEEFLANIVGCLRVAYAQVHAWGRLSAAIRTSLPAGIHTPSTPMSESSSHLYMQGGLPQLTSSSLPLSSSSVSDAMDVRNSLALSHSSTSFSPSLSLGGGGVGNGGVRGQSMQGLPLPSPSQSLDPSASLSHFSPSAAANGMFGSLPLSSMPSSLHTSPYQPQQAFGGRPADMGRGSGGGGGGGDRETALGGGKKQGGVGTRAGVAAAGGGSDGGRFSQVNHADMHSTAFGSMQGDMAGRMLKDMPGAYGRYQQDIVAASRKEGSQQSDRPPWLVSPP
eukprot:CAMPEP_0113869592 /NCGR_PEP_ID=MMETSP0780_2-20120614/1620_1 /TAXON_ID=652834 /ORGANISM="Palpitomonas bilix" /LENGTH=796 /DNA_ID=CAMNT_0000854783 /DNA_START=4320 /DNA_END=6710 /DNA_ORIENTATION=- /assembly_acc=CAM_ASM_000599